MDMRLMVHKWKVGYLWGLTDEERQPGGTTEARLTCPSDKPVTMEIQVAGADPPERGKVCIVQGVSESEELWAVRMDHTGRLFLHLGTAGRRETEYAHFLDFVLALSYNPSSGNISLSVRDEPPGAGGAELLGGGARNQWVEHIARHDRPPRESWQLCLGCPQDGRADKPPLGWTISASFRFGATTPGHKPTGGPWYRGRDLEALEARLAELGIASIGPDLPPPHCRRDGQGALGSPQRRQPPHPLQVRALLTRDALYALAAEGADHTEFSAHWHKGVLDGARAMGWKGGAA